MEASLLKKDEFLQALLYKMELGGDKFRIVEVIEVWLVLRLTSSRELKVVTTDDTMVETLNKAFGSSHKWYEEKRISVVTNGVLYFRLAEAVSVWEPTLDSINERAPMIRGLSPEERIALGVPE